MKTLIRSLIAITLLAVALAACTTAAPPAASPSTPPSETPSAEPSPTPTEEPAETPDAPAEVVGTFTMINGVATTGPGIPLAEAIANPGQETIVNGALYMDTDGTLFLAASVTDASAPTFGGPLLRVLGYPEGGAEWDPANAGVTGLQQANGILFFEESRLYGVIELDS
jgi:hypothetical protein